VRVAAAFLPERFRPTPRRSASPQRVVTVSLLAVAAALVPQWRLTAVEIRPGTPIPAAARSSLAELVGTPLIFLDLTEVRDLVECWPAVDGSTVSLDLAGTLRVSAGAGSAVASLRRGRSWQAVVGDGRPGHLLTEPTAPVLAGFPPVTSELRRGLAVAHRIATASRGTVEQVRRITPTDLEVTVRLATEAAPTVVVHVHPDGSGGERAWLEALGRCPVPSWADARSDLRLVVRGWA
jgi:hypothetical protein